MRPFIVIHPHPGMAHHFGFLDPVEAIRVQHFFPEASVVALHVAVLVGFAFLNEFHFDGSVFGPYSQLFSDELRTIIHPDFLWCAPPGDELIQLTDHTLAGQRSIHGHQQSLTIMVIDDVQRTEVHTIIQRVVYKVHAPGKVGVDRP